MAENETNIQSIEEAVREANKYAKTVKEPQQQKEHEKNVKEFKEIIDSEKEFLQRFHEDRFKPSIEYGGKIFEFKIKPIENTKDIENLGLDFRAYMDLDDLEKEVILKKNRGETLTASEQEVYNEKEKEFASGAVNNALDQAHHILATFVTPPSFSRTKDPQKRYNKRLESWRYVPFDLKMLLFNEVINCLGLNPEAELKLFPTN
jgi:hypothetical protein